MIMVLNDSTHPPVNVEHHVDMILTRNKFDI